MTGPVEVMTHKDEGGVETVSNQGSTDLAQDQPFESDQRFSREVPSVMENAISSFTFELWSANPDSWRSVTKPIQSRPIILKRPMTI